jgi:hypothetical protein
LGLSNVFGKATGLTGESASGLSDVLGKVQKLDQEKEKDKGLLSGFNVDNALDKAKKLGLGVAPPGAETAANVAAATSNAATKQAMGLLSGFNMDNVNNKESQMAASALKYVPTSVINFGARKISNLL